MFYAIDHFYPLPFFCYTIIHTSKKAYSKVKTPSTPKFKTFRKIAKFQNYSKQKILTVPQLYLATNGYK